MPVHVKDNLSDAEHELGGYPPTAPTYFASEVLGAVSGQSDDVNTIKAAKKVDGNLRDLLKNRRHLKNMLILMSLWIVSAFDYYLINF